MNHSRLTHSLTSSSPALHFITSLHFTSLHFVICLVTCTIQWRKRTFHYFIHSFIHTLQRTCYTFASDSLIHSLMHHSLTHYLQHFCKKWYTQSLYCCYHTLLTSRLTHFSCSKHSIRKLWSKSVTLCTLYLQLFCKKWYTQSLTVVLLSAHLRL